MQESVPSAGRARSRLSPDERRRQLVGIGLRRLVERPIQDLPIDEVAAEAGISRGLLFHYFPTKNDFYAAVVAAAGRRVLRTIAPDDGVSGDAALEQLLHRYVEQIGRRRESYLALVHGRGPVGGDEDLALGLRMAVARLVASALELPEAQAPVVHGWVAYVEDRALQWSEAAPQRRTPSSELVEHCSEALRALLALR
ncbi:TetR/AcrR family transcriptional regulator [Luteipulveratus sp. YIM 133132]|uniref:TetR/AcrR family transcriptional regulator n=1 Tax=Luteipulveratus flavus TaxID=3031728 RepID=UPI0023B1F2A4|nr:TetR/AcrR family transcriptional regulator [Luteipulveratus sp. YIM 133132]MDE9366141.1 TetR/AcrR family transcriptional regulator [Luteipulveratus sp. YIM 133132]